MTKKKTSLISPDDFSPDQPMMVLRSRGQTTASETEGRFPVDMSDPLCGVVLEIKAMNFPFLFVVASCPIRGQRNRIVDIRRYDFIRVDRDFANQVIGSITVVEDETDGFLESDKICGQFPDKS